VAALWFPGGRRTGNWAKRGGSKASKEEESAGSPAASTVGGREDGGDRAFTFLRAVGDKRVRGNCRRNTKEARKRSLFDSGRQQEMTRQEKNSNQNATASGRPINLSDRGKRRGQK